jgi:hypothetical protein
MRFYDLAVRNTITSNENNDDKDDNENKKILCLAHQGLARVSFEVFKLFARKEPEANLIPCEFYTIGCLQNAYKAIELAKIINDNDLEFKVMTLKF